MACGGILLGGRAEENGETSGVPRAKVCSTSGVSQAECICSILTCRPEKYCFVATVASALASLLMLLFVVLVLRICYLLLCLLLLLCAGENCLCTLLSLFAETVQAIQMCTPVCSAARPQAQNVQLMCRGLPCRCFWEGRPATCKKSPTRL